jgi:hypothetical protein
VFADGHVDPEADGILSKDQLQELLMTLLEIKKANDI